MSYGIHLKFVSDLPTRQLAVLMQGLYDLNGVDGMFFINNEPPGDRYAHFHRETEDDIEYILNRLPKGVEVTDEMLTKAAGEQMLAELTVYDSAEALAPIIQAVREGNFTLKGVEGLRPVRTADVVGIVDYCGQICGGGECGDGPVCLNGIDPATHMPPVINERYADSIIGNRVQNYDALEIQGVINLLGPDDPEGTCYEVNNANPEIFSVYAHLKTGGVECVGDFGTHLLAEQYAKELSLKYGWPVYDFAKSFKQQLAA